jgi:hypothetical protein
VGIGRNVQRQADQDEQRHEILHGASINAFNDGIAR